MKPLSPSHDASAHDILRAFFGLKRESVKTKERRGKTAEGGWYDETLFERLRVIRNRIAGENRVPPCVIFSDTTLRELRRHFPKTASRTRRISGKGEVKLQPYGEDVLEEIMAHGGNGR